MDKLSDLTNYTKEELIETVKSLQAHNFQLKNIISKSQNIKDDIKHQKPFDFSKCRFRRVFLRLFYLGWELHGFAVQEDTTETVECHLFKALQKTCLIKDRASSSYHRCGRTDKGVSAFGQVISINLRSKLGDDDQNQLDKELDYCKLLNRVLPDTIQCVAWCPIVSESFSARFSCKSRTYKYFFPRGNLDVGRMAGAMQHLLGTHDFRNFCKMDVANGVVEYVRNVLYVDIHCLDDDIDDFYSMYVLTIEGKAFLWHQIRCIMGLLFLIGQNKERPELIEELLDVEKNPRKPDYNMAIDIPLNLFFCNYDDIGEWFYNSETLQATINKLAQLWTFSAVKTTMTKVMLNNLEETYDQKSRTNCLSEHFIQGVKAKNYVPVMKRTLCESLEDRILHYSKKKKS